MGLRDQVPLVTGWLDALFFLSLGLGGIFLLINGMRRDDALGPFFVVVGLLVAAAAVAGYFFGWRP